MKRFVVALLIAPALAPPGPARADPSRILKRETFACLSWAAWHDYGQASLTARGALPSASCPRRLPRGAAVTVLDDDAGEGAVEVRYQGKSWFIDAQRLD